MEERKALLLQALAGMSKTDLRMFMLGMQDALTLTKCQLGEKGSDAPYDLARDVARVAFEAA